MRTVRAKGALLFLLILVVLAFAGTVSAWVPSEAREGPRAKPEVKADERAREPSESKESTESGPRPMWVPSSANPGFYAARDNRNLNPTEYNLAGGHQSFYWGGGSVLAQLEPTEGSYNWSIIDNFIAAEAAQGKDNIGFGIITFNGRVSQGNLSDPPIRTPDWVFAAGAKKVICPDLFEIPRYWDPVYLTKYGNFIAALAARYDGDPRIDFIQIGVGKFGEAQPCDDRDDASVIAAMAEDGKSEWDWPYMVNDIVDIYANNFSQTRLFLYNAPTFKHASDRKIFGDHAVGLGVGLFPAGLFPDLEWVDLRDYVSSGGTPWHGYGMLDHVLDQAEETPDRWWSPVPIAFEIYDYMIGGSSDLGDPPDPEQFFWAIAGGLSRRADYITVERNALYMGRHDDPVVTPLYANIRIMGWAKEYLGKELDDIPSAWVLLRESGYRDSYYPQKGNYGFGVQQDDSISGGRTVVASYRHEHELVRDPAFYPAGVRAEIVSVDDNPSLSVLRNPDPSDTMDTNPSFKGWICRRTDQATNNRYMWFKIDDDYVYGGPAEATITVDYFDRRDGASDTWQLVYAAVGNSYKVAGTVVKANTNTWKQASFHVTDAMFANMQLGGADFRIDCMGDGDEYVHMVEVEAGDGGGELHNISLTTANGGWNFVSIRLIPSSTAIADVLSSINGKYDLVQAYDAGAWRSYQPGIGGTLTVVDQAMGLWIHVTQDCTLSVVGEAPTSTLIHLSSASGGWNMIGWPSDDSPSISTALAGIAGHYDLVYTYNAFDLSDPWKVYNPSAPSYANDLQQASSGWAHWVRVLSDCDLVVDY